MSDSAPILPYATTAARLSADEVVLLPPPPAWEIALLAVAGFVCIYGTIGAIFAVLVHTFDRRPQVAMIVLGSVCFLAGAYGVFYFVRVILRRWRWGHLPVRVWRSDAWLIVDDPGRFGLSPRRYLRAGIKDVSVDRAGWSTNLRRLYRLRLRSGPRVRLMISFTLGSGDEPGEVRRRVTDLLRARPEGNFPT
jgi:hypothetical protein